MRLKKLLAGVSAALLFGVTVFSGGNPVFNGQISAFAADSSEEGDLLHKVGTSTIQKKTDSDDPDYSVCQVNPDTVLYTSRDNYVFATVSFGNDVDTSGLTPALCGFDKSWSGWSSVAGTGGVLTISATVGDIMDANGITDLSNFGGFILQVWGASVGTEVSYTLDIFTKEGAVARPKYSIGEAYSGEWAVLLDNNSDGLANINMGLQGLTKVRFNCIVTDLGWGWNVLNTVTQYKESAESETSVWNQYSVGGSEQNPNLVLSQIGDFSFDMDVIPSSDGWFAIQIGWSAKDVFSIYSIDFYAGDTVIGTWVMGKYYPLTRNISISELLADTEAIDVASVTFSSDAAFTLSYTKSGETTPTTIAYASGSVLTDMELDADADFIVASVTMSKEDVVDNPVTWTVNTHTWNSAQYTWSNDNSKCTAEIACSDEGCTAKKATETVDSTNTVEDSTCTAKGKTTYKAEFKNTLFATQTKEVEIELKAHTLVDVDAVAPKCEEVGYTAGKQCSVCKEYIEGHDEVPATDHTPAEAVKEKVVDATCTIAGSYDEVVYCSVCKKEISRTAKTVDPLGVKNEETGVYEHKWHKNEDGSVGACDICGQEYCDHEGKETEVRDAVAAECEKKGYSGDTYCKNCGTLLERGSETTALEHTWGNWTVTTEPGYGVKGEETRECSACHKKETQEVEALVIGKYSVDGTEEGALTWNEGKDGDLTVTLHRDIDDENAIDLYMKTGIDGNDVDATAVKGSVKVTISKDVLKELADGEHTIRFTFADSDVDVKLNVIRDKATDTDGTSPAGVLVLFAMLAASAAGLCFKKYRA